MLGPDMLCQLAYHEPYKHRASLCRQPSGFRRMLSRTSKEGLTQAAGRANKVGHNTAKVAEGFQEIIKALVRDSNSKAQAPGPRPKNR